MPYRLRMPAQIGEWLADLRRTEPLAAAEVGATLMTMLNAEQVTGLPFVRDADGIADADPRELLDYSYQQQLGELQEVRRRFANVATHRAAVEEELATLRAQPDHDAAAIEGFEQQAADAREEEQRLGRRSQQLQGRVDAFRTRKETIKATYTATEAQAKIADAMEKLEQILANLSDEEPAEGRSDDAELTNTARDDSGTAEDSQAGPGQHESEVLELTADPAGADIRILFAIEPASTLTLLTALEGPDAVQENRSEALHVAADLLGEIRADSIPSTANEADDDWLEFAGAPSFLHRFFGDDSAAVASRATELGRQITLAKLREDRDMSLRDLARATGIDERRLADIERDGPHSASLDELAAYLRQLGDRLELTVVVDGERLALG